MNTEIATTPKVQVQGQCAWCLQSAQQAFALVCPQHVSDWFQRQDDILADIRALCRAVGEFDGARPESPRVVMLICIERIVEWRQRAEAAEAKIDKLENLLARAYSFLTWPDDVRGADTALDAEFDGIVTDVEVAIQHLPDDKEY